MGKLVNVNALNVNNLPSKGFAYICCDPSSHAYPGYLSPTYVINIALTPTPAGPAAVRPSAIILYSLQSNHCNFTAGPTAANVGIYTTIDPIMATTLANLNLNAQSGGSASILPDLTSFTNYSGSSTFASNSSV